MNEDLTQRALERLAVANKQYRQGKEAGTVLSVLLLALSAREIYGEQARYVRLDYSDQGDFMSLDAVLDEREQELDDEDKWDAFSEDAEGDYAWNLDTDDRGLWKDYTLTPDNRRENVIDIDSVITRIGGQL